MSLHEEFDHNFYSEYTYEDKVADLTKKKMVKRMLDDRLERKRLKDEFKDELDELSGEFDWDEIYK